MHITFLSDNKLICIIKLICQHLCLILTVGYTYNIALYMILQLLNDPATSNYTAFSDDYTALPHTTQFLLVATVV
jgi:hypothetical protein